MVWDVVIIGAGPAGSNTATVALNAGLSVVQLDKKIFPRNKACAGGLTTKSLRSVQIPIETKLRRKFSVIECNIWGDEVNRFSHRNVMISMIVRSEFDNYFVEHNRRYPNFEFLDGEVVKSITYDEVFRVVTTKQTIIGRQLVGADGANGIVNRIFKVSSPRLAYAVEINPRRSMAYEKTPLQPCIDLCVVHQGYGWVFPKDDQWSVGIYTLVAGVPKLKDLLTKYLQAKGIIVQGGPLATFEAHPIPIGGYRLNIPDIPVYIVGDAGGFADAILGEGIFYALESGRLAGFTIVSAIKDKKSHRDYYSALYRRVIPDTFLTYQLAKLIYGEYRGLGWRLGKRFLQRLLVQGYAEGSTFTEALLKSGLFIPKSFKDATMEVKAAE